VLLLLVLAAGRSASALPRAQQTGAIRGVVYDKDFDVPLAGASVSILERDQKTVTTPEGSYLLAEIAPGTYTLVFAKEGYVRQLRSDVVVQAGQLTEIDVWLTGEFVELEEFVVQDLLQLGTGSEAALLQLRFESPSLIDSIGADLMSKAGASDAAGALKLVTGATVKDGKSAVIRGLPDRYVSSQINSVRLPSADEDKRAVELDQFPSAVIESLQVSKTFTPDQQGDASGGAVNLLLRGVPEETVLSFKTQFSYNSGTSFRNDFLNYEGGGFDFFGRDGGRRPLQLGNLGGNWDGAVAATEEDAPIDYKLGLDAGTKVEIDGVKFGGFTSLFYERDSELIDDKHDDSLWSLGPGQPLTPEYQQGAPGLGEFRTSLYDIVEGSQSVRLGGLVTLGVETERHSVNLTYLATRSSEDKATLAIDTRGKQFFFPGYDPDDPSTPGHGELDEAPYLRTETLEFTKRDTSTLQLSGRHLLGSKDPESESTLGAPELDWTVAHSTAKADQPDKRLFSAAWWAFGSGLWIQYKPAASFSLGNLQRTFKTLEEESDQYLLNLKVPFEQWSGLEAYAKFGLFSDSVDRIYDQDTFSNFNDNSSFSGGFDDPWSGVFPDENHPIGDGTGANGQIDTDYDGDQDIRAWYGMVDLPINQPFSVLAGVRFESTDITTVVSPEPDARWLNPEGNGSPEDLDPGEADVDFSQDDVLPALAFTYRPNSTLTFRGAYTQTVARQTFKELTPIIQQDYVGGPVFSGNPDLGMSNLENYDLRVDFTPQEGSLVSLSWFYKYIEDPIEYVQRSDQFTFTQPRNYPEGELTGYEIEVRQELERYFESCEGLALGANATFIDSEVQLPQDEIDDLSNAGDPTTSRDATNAPDYLYNLYLTYDLEPIATQIGLFYTVQGDTLLTGAGTRNNTQILVPSVYQKEYGSLNFSISRVLGPGYRLQFQAKNLTDPDIETVYRSPVLGDTSKSSYSLGREYSLTLSVHL